MKTGANGGLLRVLPDQAVQRVHQASLQLLQEHGVFSESDLFLDIFEKAGAKVDRDSRIIYLMPDMVEAAIESAPSSFVLYGRRDPEMDMLLEVDRVYYGMGGTSEPLFWDYDSWQPRKPTKQDMINSTRLGHALTNIDWVQTLCMAGDKPTNQIFLHDFDAIFRNTSKPSVINVMERPFTQRLLALAAAAHGGEDVLREKPSVLGIVTPVSPMQIAIMNEGIVDAVEAGVPILYSPGPMMGATSPATVAGTILQANAEVLFGVVLTQIIKPGAPVVLKPDTDVFDMKTTQCTYGSPEQDLGKIAMVQMARQYAIPIYGLGGGVDAKVPDAEAGIQAGLTMLLNGLAGTTMSQALGSMAFGLYGCQEMVVICDEIVHTIKRVLDGVNFNEDTLAVDVIRQVGHGQSFLDHDHTVQHFRQEMFFPKLFARKTIDQWQNAGGKMAHETAHERVLDILSKGCQVEIPDSVDRAMEDALRAGLKAAEQAHSSKE